MAEPVFLEIVFQQADWTFDGRDEIEDLLDEALADAGVGEVAGGGSGMGIVNIDVEVADLDAGLAVVRRVLQKVCVARSTVIKCYEPARTAFPVYT